jgi:hypothetical protein
MCVGVDRSEFVEHGARSFSGGWLTPTVLSQHRAGRPDGQHPGMPAGRAETISGLRSGTVEPLVQLGDVGEWQADNRGECRDLDQKPCVDHRPDEARVLDCGFENGMLLGTEKVVPTLN